MSEYFYGEGEISPLDAEEKVKIKIKSDKNTVLSAEYEIDGDKALSDCAKALCGVIEGKPVADLFQMNANAVVYNLEEDLPRDRLYLASMCVTAAKRAAAEICRKTGTDVPHTDGCNCY